MLESRDSRAAYQTYLIDKYKTPLVSFTAVMPGSVKQNEMSEKIFSSGRSAIEKALENHKVVYKEIRVKKTGSEAFYCVDLPILTLKREMVEVEENEKLGRLFDIDVISTDKKPVSRSILGKGERRCLICDGDAHACSRAKKHTSEDLLKAIERLLADE